MYTGGSDAPAVDRIIVDAIAVVRLGLTDRSSDLPFGCLPEFGKLVSCIARVAFVLRRWSFKYDPVVGSAHAAAAAAAARYVGVVAMVVASSSF